MTVTKPFDDTNFKEKMGLFHLPAIQKMENLLTHYIYFHLFAFFLLVLELALFNAFLIFFGKSTLLAFLLAIFFLTLFAFFVLRLYFQARKPEQLIHFAEEYVEECKKTMGFQAGIAEHHMALASSMQMLAQELHEKEYSLYLPPPFLQSFAKNLEKWGAMFHWKDLHQMKEYMLMNAVEEQIKAIHLEPINLEIHVALANGYVMLSSLYADPRKYEGWDEEKFIPKERLSEQMQERFCEVAKRAIEEFKILNDYAPNDPWVHRQLAYSYHDLQMPEEEVKEYEKLSTLCPQDKEILYKLGLLYFSQGKNALGLRIYESLKKMHYKKAESLIKFYGN